MNERKLIREFLNSVNPIEAHIKDELHISNSEVDDNSDYYDYTQYDEDSLSHDSSQHELDPDGDGYVTSSDLYAHFDLSGDEKVTTQEYVDHINFHCQHPESLDHYKKAREESVYKVPCANSYDACSQHLMGCPDDIDKYLKPLMDCTGSTCRESSTRALLDVLQSLINCGVFG